MCPFCRGLTLRVGQNGDTAERVGQASCEPWFYSSIRRLRSDDRGAANGNAVLRPSCKRLGMPLCALGFVEPVITPASP